MTDTEEPRVSPCGSFAHFDDMCWSVPGERLSEIDWQLRYGKPDKIALLNAASVISAYQALIHKPRRERDRIISKIRKAQEKYGSTAKST